MGSHDAEELDPFGALRHDAGLMEGCVGTDRFVMALRHDDLRRVARDWRTFTSDAPFRVPIPSEHDVRPVRQLPIECDPPAHTAYRSVVQEIFSRAVSAGIEPAVAATVDSLLHGALERGRLEAVRELALPVQCQALALMLGRSRDEADEWISWGTHVFRDLEETGESHAADLDRYLGRVIAEARREPRDDFFGRLATAEVEGRPLTEAEMMGFANLTFAGGRDTIIHSIVNTLHLLATRAELLSRLRDDAGLHKSAVEELLRYFSPLTHIGRIATHQTTLGGRTVAAAELVSMGFASANRDESVFDRPDEVVLDRHPNRHVAFGHGPHTCLGAPHARMVLRVVIARVLDRVGRLEVVESVPKVEDLGPVTRLVSYDPLTLGLSPP